MGALDNIFTGSTLTETERHASTIFGRLLIKLREEGRVRLKNLMDAVSGSDMAGNVIILTVSDKNTYQMLNNRNDIKTLNSVLDTIESGVTIGYRLVEKKKYNQHKFEQYLRETFGSVVTIKKVAK